MGTHSTFRITYWGTTGSLTRPLLPCEVTDKLVRAIGMLSESGALRDLAGGKCDETMLRQRIEQDLPFYLRGTYGGNTTCIEIETEDELLIVDSGSGFRDLGIDLARRWNAPGYAGRRSAHVLLTHAHMDHTYGTPFFDPYYDPRNEFRLWGESSAIDSLNILLNPASSLTNVYFPPSFSQMAAIKELRKLGAGEVFQIGQTQITTFALVHPGGCLAYRLDRGGRRVVIATDHEQPEVPDRRLAEFAAGADLFYMDAQYLAAELEGREGIMGEPPQSRRGWGHSSVEACVATAVLAGARQLHLGHREPKRSDEDTHRLEQLAQRWILEALQAASRDAASCPVQFPYEGLAVEI